VREQQHLLAKVSAVNGDITQPGLGLAPAITHQLQQQLHIILHCAADIRLEVSKPARDQQACCNCAAVGCSGAPAAAGCVLRVVLLPDAHLIGSSWRLLAAYQVLLLSGLLAGCMHALRLQLSMVCAHCCAQVDIQTALRSNYLGTQEVLQLACSCKQLKALVHTSSCFVNMNQPRSSVVQERIYPLMFGTRCACVVWCGLCSAWQA
jgi:hypothetical protein